MHMQLLRTKCGLCIRVHTADHMQLPTASDSRNFLWKLSEGKKPIPPPGLIAAYSSQLANTEYMEFVKEVPSIAGTWDDHDMGEDNANKMYTFKYESKEAMLNFLGVDGAAAIRSLDWKGVYSSHEIYIGEDLNVKVIFLDLRFEKDSWWLMDMGDMLGEQQWSWLQQELHLSTADVNLVVSSLQTFANHRQGALVRLKKPVSVFLNVPVSPLVLTICLLDTDFRIRHLYTLHVCICMNAFSRLVTETWSHFPWARERLFALLAGSGAKTPIILSGDTHFAEFAAIHCQRLPENWCLNEPEVRSYLTAFHSRATGNLTPLQQIQRLAGADADDLSSQIESEQTEGTNINSDCDSSVQCCTLPPTPSQLFWWIPRHIPFFLLALFRAATKPDVFAPRQGWRRPRAPAYSGAFPPPPFAADQPPQDGLLREDRSSLYLFDMTSSGLGHGVPESMCRAAPAMVELAAYFLTEGVPFASSLNADITGPRLVYTERNFGELEFIENPVQIILFPSTNDRIRNEARRQEYLQELSENSGASGVQLHHVRKKGAAIRHLHHQQQQRRPLHLHRKLTANQASRFRIRLQAYKKQRERLVGELALKSAEQLAIVERIRSLSREFEAYTQAVLSGNAIFFSRLLQLHAALLLVHACEDEGVGRSGTHSPSRSNLLFTSCSLLAPWESISRPSTAGSFADTVLRWLWDRMFGLTSWRETFNSTLPVGDAAALRLSAAADQLARLAATARAAVAARLAESRRLLPSKFIGIRVREPALFHLLRAKAKRRDRRLLLLGIFAAASDRLLRQACLQLQSPRRQQQRDEMYQLFQRGVANRPADPFVFADLDPDLQLVCSLVNIPEAEHQSRLSETRLIAPGVAHFAGNHAASAVADSWVLVELLETKTWILSRTFDAVTGRLAKEKLLSSFASEQRLHQPGFGQWACQGWKGPTESGMYLCHLCILGASVLVLGAVIVIIIVILLFAFKAASLFVASLRRLCRSGCIISNEHACGSSAGQHKNSSLRQKALTLKVAALVGVIMSVEVSEA
ncbi:hypothetical protein, conserved [Eimeria praecox]|uniref:PhoD-like phosphatase metallophosphatase domain-containing protein n=1 Tax=Eimeria praecox TaxID=51316 RepID=U6H1Z5_9EIME|nr:hypothetical protein, conserved [Eimeria praecox]